MRRAPLPARFLGVEANSSKQTAAPFFSMRLATCRWPHRPRCSGSCRNGRFSASAEKKKISVNVRVICATNHDLEQAMQKGTFRMDLFYRINMFVIEVPPLRERLSDVPELASHFLAVAHRAGKYQEEGISQE